MPRQRNKLGTKKLTDDYKRPSKPKGQRFLTTAKETQLERIKEAAKTRRRSPDDLSINWESLNSTTNKVQPLGGVFQTKLVRTKTGPYAPVSVRRYKRFSKD